ncbi:hypothetical protein [Parabacteroides sp. AM08-6]|uniref:hypothetical protein n=1 Tax=Parabacteroides sp. AM08-6 TaxID=2292053 RepID=UPI000F0060AD|nr:hypothetical protein [Parabacteroides sp. AM08-6]RHJ75764.1 hypothetical protein DW103_17385 [Parabacteroides sp. AM08-6]
MKINKLTKEEKAEGLTLDLVNKVNLRKKCSPVMFKAGDEPVGIMECSTGYWVHTSDGYLRDDKGALIVFGIRECQIARARYLMYHGEEEKRLEAELVLEQRKRKIQEKLDVFKKNIEDIRQYTIEGSTTNVFAKILESAMSVEQRIFVKAENERKVNNLPQMEAQYDWLTSEFEKGNYNLLLDIMGIEKIPNPVTFKLDNEDDMRMLKNAFGKQAIDEAQGDVNKLYARLKVEQMYNV